MNARFIRCLFLLVITLRIGLPLAGYSQSIVAQTRTPRLRFSVYSDGAYELFDEHAQVLWRGADVNKRFGRVTLVVDGKPRPADLTQGKYEFRDQGVLASFHPLPETPDAELRVRVRALPDHRSLEVSYRADESLKIDSISLLDSLISVTDSKGYVVVPVREGLLIPANSGLAFDQRFDTYAYEGCHMEMLGAVNQQAAVLVTWVDPHVAAHVKSVTNSPASGCSQELTSSLSLRKSAASFRLQVLGKGDYIHIAQAYQKIAEARGLVVPWSKKLEENPTRAKLMGAANIKLWSTLDRRMNEDSTKEESVHVNWTFEEAAQVAEHLKGDLKLDKVLFTIGGWIRRGYDNQHPDILPTAPECGGDAAFADCARRVMKLGYLFCLHDNYQDIYRDSPSWDEKYVMKTPDGKLAKGGHWAGGTAYLTCSKMALELAQRPQNLSAVKQLSEANSYFIDTTYAAGLQECFDPHHPLTRADDMRWKQALSDYARSVFGVFGSECGREWALPHSDFFEGLTGVSGTYYHDAKLPARLGASVIPLFELVYRDGIAMYGKYGYDPDRAAEYVLHHIIIGRPLNYHSMPHHLYWKNPDAARPAPSSPDSVFVRGDNGWSENLHPMDRFIKNTCEVLCPLNEITAQGQMATHEFLSADRKVQRSVFGRGKGSVQVIVNAGTNNFSFKTSQHGQVQLPPFGFLVEGPQFAAFHALSWNGLSYERSAMFTLRSLDHRPLSRSSTVRVFHAFGPDSLRLRRKDIKVHAEEIVRVGAD